MYSIALLFMALWWIPPALGAHCDLKEGCQTLCGELWIMCSGLGYRSGHLTSPASHTASTAPPAKHGGILIEQGPFRGRMCHSSTPQAFHLHPLLPCGPPSSKLLPPTLRWILSAAGKQKAWVHSWSADFQRRSPASRLLSLAMTWEEGLLWEVERSSQIHQGQQSVGNRGEGSDCKREEFNGKPRSACTWLSALL